MAKLPSFPLYAQDFDMDTNTWTNEEIGIYIRLLLSEWINGPLPNDDFKLSKIARIGRKKFSNIFPNIKHKFTENEEKKLINIKMEDIRKEALEWREKSKIGGLRSAAKRKQQKRKVRVVQPPLEPPHQPNRQPNGNSSPSPSYKNISKEIYEFYCAEIFPLQKSKKRAVKNISYWLTKYNKDQLIKTIQNYKTITDKREPEYRKDPANFFGRREPAFSDYLEGEFKKQKTQPIQKTDIPKVPKDAKPPPKGISGLVGKTVKSFKDVTVLDEEKRRRELQEQANQL